MIRGDHYNCKCPYCGKNNNYVTTGVVVTPRSSKLFRKECHWCKQPITYHAEMTITVKAYKQNEDPLLEEILDKNA